MKYSLTTLLAFILVFSAWAQKQLVVDEHAEIRPLTGSFTSISVSDGIDVYLSQSDDEAMAVSASEKKYADNIKTIIEGATLKIWYDGSNGWRGKNLKVYISFKEIDRLSASGASDIIIAGTVKSPRLTLTLSGASSFRGNVETGDLVMDMSGASDVIISGNATMLDIENSGASDLKGSDLVVNVCNAKSSGASDVHITVTKELNVNASGASDVFYRGDAIVKTVHTSGASKVARQD